MEVDGDPAGDTDALVNDCKFNMKLHMADSAWKQVKKVILFLNCMWYLLCSHMVIRSSLPLFQNNFPVATKLLKELHREAKTNRGWLMQWVHSFSRYSHKRCQSQGPVEQISAMLKTIPLLGKKRISCYTAGSDGYLTVLECNHTFKFLKVKVLSLFNTPHIHIIFCKPDLK